MVTDETGKENKCGFYVTRDVEADSFEDAELKAVDLVRGDEALRNSTVNPLDDPPKLYLETIRLLGDDETSINNSGHVFYNEAEVETIDELEKDRRLTQRKR